MRTKTFKIKTNKTEEVKPFSRARITKERIMNINENLKRVLNEILIGDEVTGFVYNDNIFIKDLGIFATTAKKAPPLRKGLAVNSNGELIVVNHYGRIENLK